jgi:hypothetical protein
MSSSINRTRSGTITLGTAGTAVGTAVVANNVRQHLIIQTGTAGLYYGFSTATGANGIWVAGGTTTNSDLWGYTGPLYVTTGSGSAPYKIAELSI